MVQSNVNIARGDIDGRSAVTFLPQIVLWNPYDIVLQPADYVLEFGVPYNDPVNTIALTLLGLNKE
jgi:hypothetical protein